MVIKFDKKKKLFAFKIILTFTAPTTAKQQVR